MFTETYNHFHEIYEKHTINYLKLVIRRDVRYRKVSATEKFVLQCNNYSLQWFVLKIGLRNIEMSALKHNRYREAPMN